MADRSKIEWCDATWNCVTGCTKVSQGCRHCYAERDWRRLSANPTTTYYGRAFADVQCHPERLGQPLHWTKPRRIFVNSMSDLFHESVPDAFIERVWATMTHAKQHIFQILTKRPERMQSVVKDLSDINGRPLPNVWCGVSAENQAAADERIPKLLDTPTAVRFVSIEPMIGPVDLRMGGMSMPDYAPHRPQPRLNWVICGGESGPRARPMHPGWVRSLRDQCIAAGVPFLLKQWGEWTPGENVTRHTGTVETAAHWDGKWYLGRQNLAANDEHRDDEPDLYRVGKRVAGRLLDGREWNEFPEGAAT